MRTTLPFLLLTTAACGEQRLREDWTGWYDAGSDLDVEESIEFTETNYDFTGPTPISAIPTPDAAVEDDDGRTFTWFAGDDPPAAGCADWEAVDTLPVEIEGIVTLRPRWYIKITGCLPENDGDVDSDEKYYGNYFIQDSSGGSFVLGDSKVARFDMGDRVRLRVRAVKDHFQMPMIAAHDVVEVERGPEPIYYEAVLGRDLGDADVGKVVRIAGMVLEDQGNFGEIYLCGEAGLDVNNEPGCHKVSIDQELQRRGITLPVGTRQQVTGPVQYGFGEYQVNLMRVGQLEQLSE